MVADDPAPARGALPARQLAGARRMAHADHAPAFRKPSRGYSRLKPVYLIAGAEHLLVIEAADVLRARARELGYVERESARRR